jgi:cytochrome P450
MRADLCDLPIPVRESRFLMVIQPERRAWDIREAFDKGQPYAHYTWFRDNDPVHVGTEPAWPLGHPYVSLFRFDDVMNLLRNPEVGVEGRRLAAEARPAGDPAPQPNMLGQVFDRFMLFRDPPDHTRLRSVANMAFTPRNVAGLKPDIERIATTLLTEARARGGVIDLIEAFTYPLPVYVIGKILGVPEVDLPRFREWAGVLAAAIDFNLDEQENVDETQGRAAMELYAYLSEIVESRRAHPQDDLISKMIHAESEEGRMDRDELVATAILLLFAGHETTTNLIGNGTLSLLQHPDQWDLLKAQPELAGNAAEELLRYESPVQLTTRTAYADLEIGGTAIPRGTNLDLYLGSANRDPAAFPDPDRLDITRQVGRTMAFGMGIHFCLGSALARMEGAIAFETLARLAPDLRLATNTPKWRRSVVLHGLQELPVTFG